mmetsp:Transcript_54335/g.116003  ORF Transcript_54335/g.116003 Transcript_54335/m.116003 type:complete len:332 (-) Transcript_54335:351-1346(-)
MLAMDAKQAFDRMLSETEMLRLRAVGQIPSLEARLAEVKHGRHPPHLAEELKCKVEYLTECSTFLGATFKSLKITEARISEDIPRILSTGSDQRDRTVASIYEGLTSGVKGIKAHIETILALPESRFPKMLRHLKEMAKNWIVDNPVKVVVGGGVLAGGCAGTAAYYNHWNGACAIAKIFRGATVAGQVALTESAILGGLVGIVVFIALTAVVYAVGNYSEMTTEEKLQLEKQEVREIRALVKKLEDMSIEDIAKELPALQRKLNLTFGFVAIAAEPDEARCFMCHDSYNDSLKPVKTVQCQGNHWMCTAHLEEYTATWQSRCCICQRRND